MMHNYLVPKIYVSKNAGKDSLFRREKKTNICIGRCWEFNRIIILIFDKNI